MFTWALPTAELRGQKFLLVRDDKYKHALREHCTSVGYFLGVAPVRDKCVILVWIGNRQLWSQVLICDRWFKMPGIRFVPCHSAKMNVLHCPVSTPSLCKEDWDRLFLSFGSLRRQGVGSDRPFGMNLFQVICPSQMKMQTLSLQHWSLFSFYHVSSILPVFHLLLNWSWSPTSKWFLC